MRVLLDVSAVPDQPAGAGLYIRELARRLAARDELDLVLLSRRGDRERWQRWAPGASLHDRAPRSRLIRGVWEQVVGPRLAARLGVDVWHGPHYTMPLRLRIPAVVTIHDLTFIEHPEWHRRIHALVFRRLIPASVRRATVCVCVSAFTAQRLAAAFGRTERVVVARHGVDAARFRPDGDERSDLERLAPYGVRRPYVGFLGTLEPRKGIPTLVAAFADVATARPGLVLVLAGQDGWRVHQVEEEIAARGIADRVVRTGFLPDDLVPALLRRAEVVVYPSLMEGFGLPALEALACGAPLVTTTGSAAEEVVGTAARLVPPGDRAALAAALEELLDPSAAEAMRRAGPATAARFTWEANLARHLEAYDLAFDRRATK